MNIEIIGNVLIGSLCFIIGSKLFMDALGVNGTVRGETGLLYVIVGGLFYGIAVFLIIIMPLMYPVKPV